MVDGPSSSLVAPRAAPVCPLDRPDPRARRVRPPPSGGNAYADRSAVVFLRSRPDVDVAEGGVRDRTRRGSGGGPQPPSSSTSGPVVRGVASTGVVPDRGIAACDRTDVRAVGRSRRSSARRPDDGAPGAMSDHVHTERVAVEWTRPQRTIISLIESYQHAFEGRPSPCRFFPSCSSYAHEAVVVHGTVRGGWLALRRLLRCRPLGPSGFDPVPEPLSTACSPAAPAAHLPTVSPDPTTAPDEDH